MKAGFCELVASLMADGTLSEAEAETRALGLLWKDFDTAHPEHREGALARYREARDHLVPSDEREAA